MRWRRRWRQAKTWCGRSAAAATRLRPMRMITGCRRLRSPRCNWPKIMNVEEIKTHIQTLPDDTIEGLLKWLKEYYDGEVWDRQMEADLERLGEDEFGRALAKGMEQADERKKAALRLLNSMRFASAADRDQTLHDLELVLGQGLEG